MPSGHRPPIPPGNARVALLYTFMGHAVVNVFYVALTGSGITSADLNTLATTIATTWNTNILDQLTGDVVLTEVQITYIPSVGNEVTGVWTGTHAGGSAHVTVQDASASYVLNWGISAYYRGGHPRTYLPGVGTVSVTNGSVVDPSIRSAIASGADTVRGNINAATTTHITGTTMGTMSFQSGNAWRGTPVFRPYTSTAVRSHLGSQRRRILS